MKYNYIVVRYYFILFLNIKLEILIEIFVLIKTIQLIGLSIRVSLYFHKVIELLSYFCNKIS